MSKPEEPKAQFSIEERCNCGGYVNTTSKKHYLKWRDDHRHFTPYGEDRIYSGAASLERRPSYSFIGFTIED